jgi:two-component system, LuxR family, sensor kinase FixL
MAMEHAEEVETHSNLRREAEEQVRILVESSPAAIVTIDASSKILLANEAAQSLFAPGDTSIVGQSIAEFLPALQSAVQTQGSRQFHTELRCRGKRKNGGSVPRGRVVFELPYQPRTEARGHRR